MTRQPQATRNRRRVGVGMRIGAIACAGAGALLASLPLAAHHSFSAEFDATLAIKVTGEVSKVEWMNPHAWIHLGVNEVCERTATRGPGGGGDDDDESWTCRTIGADEAAEWGFELGSPNGLMRQGWSRNSLKLGDHVTIEGSRARDGSTNGNARVVTTADGTRLFAGSSQGSTP
jgi:Family of unknown function (DUF6152)